jgi:hypothetical protein
VTTTICRGCICVLWTLFTFTPATGAPASPAKEIKVPAGQTADLWLGVNVTGKVYYTIRTKDGGNTLRMWWIMEPLGTVKQLGTRVGSGSIDIPGKLKGSISAKLRGKASADTVVYIGENVAVDNTVTFHW